MLSWDPDADAITEVEARRAFSSLSRAASLLKACSGTNRIMKGNINPAKMETSPNVHCHALVSVRLALRFTLVE
jgi:hypothetical protein